MVMLVRSLLKDSPVRYSSIYHKDRVTGIINWQLSEMSLLGHTNKHTCMCAGIHTHSTHTHTHTHTHTNTGTCEVVDKVESDSDSNPFADIDEQ